MNTENKTLAELQAELQVILVEKQKYIEKQDLISAAYMRSQEKELERLIEMTNK